jgi:hypothetical protein
MELLGNRVYLELPLIKESPISISDNVKKQIQDELLQKMDKLKVVYKGEGMGEGKLYMEKVKIGAEVFVDPGKLRLCPMFEIEKKAHVCVSVFDIYHIW